MLFRSKYKEKWKEYKDIQDRILFASKVEKDVKEFQTKYGIEGGRIFEYLVLKALEESNKDFAKIKLFNRLTKIIKRKYKINFYQCKFPYTKLPSIKVYACYIIEINISIME